MDIIAGDIGGTKTYLTLINSENPAEVMFEARYSSTAFDSFEPLLDCFISDSGLEAGELGVLFLALPGVVSGDVARLTNLPWVIDRNKLMDTYNVGQVGFMNDFQASALGTLHLEENDCIIINQGVHKPGAISVVVGAGTGLGVSWVDHSSGKSVAYATEGGHMDFAPVDTEQAGLQQFLADRFGHVSCERLLSGDGLVNIYEYLSGKDVSGIKAAWVNQEAQQGSEIAQHAMRVFVRIYGAYVGNLALLFRPEGGIYISGGIGSKMIEQMCSEDFTNAYLFKGRMQHVVERVAVSLVTNERVGVIGAISEAVRLQQDNK